MNINKNKENRDKLIKLITENPDLDVIPFTSSDTCDDTYQWYLAEFGDSFIDYVYFTEEKICIGEDDYEEHLQEYTDLTDEEIAETIKNESKKYIILYIDSL